MGYMITNINGKNIYMHELIWVMKNKKPIPNNFIVSHKNNNTSDNRRDNLHLVNKTNDNENDNDDNRKNKEKIFHEKNYQKNNVKKYIKKNFPQIFEIFYE
jgi:hypothetical protein